MLVTDVKRVLKTGKEIEGFYMQGYLTVNLAGIKKYLKKSWDVVGIVSGHGKVRIGKSTLAAQICYFIAWALAGGEMLIEPDKNGNPKKVGMKKPTKEVRFNLEENVVFDAAQLQDTAIKLYEKYGPNQVIMYDEGRQGLESKRTMETLNKGMEDFFQECGFMGHVIIIVLPNFFKLHEDYAIARSLFLIDVFADKNLNRGYFNFYNERQKENLYFFGKKRIGIMAKYMATNESFWGRFSKWLPFDEKLYNETKKQALQKKRQNRRDKNLFLQRDVLIYILAHDFKTKYTRIAELMEKHVGISPASSTMEKSTTRINEIKDRREGY